VLAHVTSAAGELGFTKAGLVPSPITGAEGNIEFLLHLRLAENR
jgi:predicted rRNA methylase YqxC with S4 and FtsJ domains